MLHKNCQGILVSCPECFLSYMSLVLICTDTPIKRFPQVVVSDKMVDEVEDGGGRKGLLAEPLTADITCCWRADKCEFWFALHSITVAVIPYQHPLNNTCNCISLIGICLIWSDHPYKKEPHIGNTRDEFQGLTPNSQHIFHSYK